MEVDHLRREEDEEEEDDECECMALHEQGFRGVCYYCQRKGHLMRGCPRKSAGLPKIRAQIPASRQNMTNRTPQTPRVNTGWKTQTQKAEYNKQKNNKRDFQKRGRVNQLEQEEDGDGGAEEQEEEEVTEEGAEDEVGFLDELTL